MDITPSITTVDHDGTATISTLHYDIIQTHILTRLDGPTLASTACTSSELHALSSDHTLWSNICQSTWPSTNTPHVKELVSTFPDGPRSFFSDSFPHLITNSNRSISAANLSIDQVPELISAVDVFYKGKLIFSKVVETETVSGWFRCSPFRVDLLDPKDVVPTPIKYPNGEDTCLELADEITLSWIVIDPNGRRAMNLSSHKPVSVYRHWLSGEIQIRFASILAGGERGSSSEFVQCGIVVTCKGSEGGDLKVREVSLLVEDMDGMHLKGRESLVILQRALEGEKVKRGRRDEEGRKRYEEYLERKRERKERKVRTEGALDMMCAVFGVLAFSSFGFFMICR
ncbi:hypothetical protein UlMin_005472 [Ulmus minor]